MNTEATETFAELGIPVNPFPGLRPFDFDESHLFFGRDGQSEQLISKLGRTHFLAVVGTSGSGKSSLVRAGLMPALLGGFMSSAGSNWRIAITRPGNDPIGNLARALNVPGVFGSEDDENAALQTVLAEAALQRGSRGLVDCVRQAMIAENENLLVVVDQFEEIFRFARISQDQEYSNEAAAFVKLLLEAAQQRELPIYVVLTMRSDYLGDCSQFWGLPEAINESQYLIPRLTRDQLREAMTGPINVARGEITPRLLARLLNDVGDNQDQLPVLQHLLMRVWDECKEQRLEIEVRENAATVKVPHRSIHHGNALDVCCYDAVGGMAQALSQHADEAFNELPNDATREIAEKVFKTLTEKGTDNREIRRPVTLGEICAVLGASASDVITVVDTFRRPGRSFLMPPADVALNSESLIDISHESLIRGWTRLKQWVDDEARSARIYLRVAETAVLRDEGGAGLWRDPDLQIALTWREQCKPNEIWARRYHAQFTSAMSFLNDSVAARDEAVQKEEARRRREIRRTRLTAVIFAVGFLVSMTAGGYAYAQKDKAQRAQQYAENQEQLAKANLVEADRQKAIAKREAGEAIIARDNAAVAELEARNQEERALASAAEAQRNLIEVKRQRIAVQLASQKVEAEELKGLALAALKDGDEQLALNSYNQLYERYKKSNDHAGMAATLISIGDIYKYRLPFELVFGDFSDLDDSEEADDDQTEEQQTTRAARAYIEALSRSLRLQGDPEAIRKQMEEALTKAREKYREALVANEAATKGLETTERRVELSVQRGNILESFGDLTLIAAATESDTSGVETDAQTKAKVEGVIKEVMQYYGQSRDIYREVEKPREEAELLRKMGFILYQIWNDKSPGEAKAGVPNEVISLYEQAGAKFGLANSPMRQAGMLVRIAEIYRELDSDSERIKGVVYFERAREIYRRLNNFNKESEIDEQIAGLHKSDPNQQVVDLRRALDVIRKAPVNESTRADRETRISDLVAKIGEVLKAIGPEATSPFFGELLASSVDDREKINLLKAISAFYKVQADSGPAVEYLTQKGLIEKQRRDFLEEGNTFVEIGLINRDLKKMEEMTTAFDVAVVAFRQVEDRTNDETLKTLSSQLKIVALNYAEVNKQKALGIYEEALEHGLVAKTLPGFELNSMVRAMAQILFDMKTDEANLKARQLFQKCIDGFKGRTGRELPDLRITLADLYKKMGDRKEARASYDQALAYFRESNFDGYDHRELIKKIAVFETEATPEKSLADFYLSEAESAGNAGDKRSQGLLLEFAGSFYRDSKDAAKALIYLEQARSLYKTLGLKTKEANMLREQADLYESTDKQKARALRKQAQQLTAP